MRVWVSKWFFTERNSRLTYSRCVSRVWQYRNGAMVRWVVGSADDIFINRQWKLLDILYIGIYIFYVFIFIVQELDMDG